MTHTQLAELANKAREKAYAPYSGFTVGAALLCDNGETVLGCNIESASYSPTCCAERVAIFKAISEGKKNFIAIAVSGGKAGEMPRERCYPCGVCRQVMAEFCPSELEVVFSDGESTTLGELLPNGFALDGKDYQR